jgi:hypothetical protein
VDLVHSNWNSSSWASLWKEHDGKLVGRGLPLSMFLA